MFSFLDRSKLLAGIYIHIYVYFSSLSTHNKAVMKEILEEVMEDPDNDICWTLSNVCCCFLIVLHVVT